MHILRNNKIISHYIELGIYIKRQNYKGYDPYDGLNSKLFNSIPFFKHSAICRLVLIQTLKRSPFNLRRFLLVPKEHNAKGIGLFLSGYCKIYPLIDKLDGIIISKDECLKTIVYLADLLLFLQSNGYSGACWGYNFDWQARRLFLFPKGTPTVVATTFCASALFEAYEITKNKKYLEVALSSANFVINDLKRHECNGGFLFSYSPLQGNDTVFNASLLGSKLLSICYHYTKNPIYKKLAKESITACCGYQSEDGSWVYGLLPVQNWIDSFHTGYNLDALATYQEYTGDISFTDNIKKGFDFYIKNFFLPDGTPKYYHNKIYPIDIHCPGQLFVTLSKLGLFKEYGELADKVMSWTIANMQDKKGYFYYQLKKGISSKISYMRWSNAFMFNAMSHYLSETYYESTTDKR